MEEELKKILKDIVDNNKNLDIRYKLIVEAMDLAIQLGYDVGIGTDNKNPSVAVVYIKLPTGQVSWHMPNDFDNWDGHSTDEKFQRIKKYIESRVIKMKRLKKAEIYDGFSYSNRVDIADNYYEVYKNPTFREIQNIKKQNDDGIRGVIDKNNDIYIWNGEVAHYIINRYVSVPVNYIRFAYDDFDHWIFDENGLGGNITLNEFITSIKNNKNTLQMIGSFDTEFCLMGITDLKYTCEKSFNNFLEQYNEQKIGEKMSRLKKIATMNLEMFKGTLSQLGDKGRDILKGIEDYKFALEQAARIVANDQQLAQKLVEKKKSLDQAAGQIYSIVFEIENIDITKEYNNQQNPQPTLEQGIPEDKNKMPNIPSAPSQPSSPTPDLNNENKNEEEKENKEENNKNEDKKEKEDKEEDKKKEDEKKDKEKK